MAVDGEDGLLAQLTKLVLESSLQGELEAHLGYGKHDPAGRDGGNSRNGTRAKTVLTKAGPSVESWRRRPMRIQSPPFDVPLPFPRIWPEVKDFGHFGWFSHRTR